MRKTDKIISIDVVISDVVSNGEKEELKECRRWGKKLRFTEACLRDNLERSFFVDRIGKLAQSVFYLFFKEKDAIINCITKIE